jgi:hypothetical protein
MGSSVAARFCTSATGTRASQVIREFAAQAERARELQNEAVACWAIRKNRMKRQLTEFMRGPPHAVELDASARLPDNQMRGLHEGPRLIDSHGTRARARSHGG